MRATDLGPTPRQGRRSTPWSKRGEGRNLWDKRPAAVPLLRRRHSRMCLSAGLIAFIPHHQLWTKHFL